MSGTVMEREQGSPPRSAGRLGLWVFLVSLTMLFGAAIVLFVLARTGGGGHQVRDTVGGARIALPAWIWASTFVVFCSSVVFHQGLQWVRLDLPLQARRALWAATGLGWGFLALQGPGLWVLVHRYREAGGVGPVAVFLVVAMAALHLLHAVAGVALMTRLAVRARRTLPDRSHAEGWALLAVYWHFLTGLWLVLFGVFAFVR
jgi:cytochrome c oxidase subunit 3